MKLYTPHTIHFKGSMKTLKTASKAVKSPKISFKHLSVKAPKAGKVKI